MSDSTVAPVKGILNAFKRGTTLTIRICRNASNGSASHTLDTVEPAQALQKSLGTSEARIRDAYAESLKAFGKRFGDGIVDNTVITNRLQTLTINLQDQVMSLDDYMDDPEAFDLGSFRYIQKESERCCDQAIHTLGMLHQAMAQDGLQRSSMGDRTFLSSQQGAIPVGSTTSRTLSPSGTAANGQDSISPPSTQSRSGESLPGSRRNGHVPNINTGTNLPSHYDTNLPTPSSYGAFQEPSPRLAAGTTVSRVSASTQPLPTPPPPPPPLAPTSAWQLPVPSTIEGPRSSTGSVGRKEVGSGDAKSIVPKSSPNRARAESTGASSIYSASGTSDIIKQPTIPEDAEAVQAVAIKSEEVERQRLKNEEFLEKRRRNRQSFQQELHQIHQNSRSSILAMVSPDSNVFGSSASVFSQADFVSSPLQQSRPASESLMARSQSREGQEQFSPGHNSRFSTATTDSRPSIASDNTSMRPGQLTRQDSGEPMIFGPPESPPMSDRGSNANQLDLGILARTLQTPDFGRGVEDGIQVIGPGLVSDPGLILAAEVGRGVAPPVTPAISVHAAEFPISSDTSFYKFGGFCEGAKMLLAGRDPLKVQKKPGGTGFTAIVSMKCSKCSYEIGFDTYENDKALDRSGIYNIVGGGGVRFRHRFLSKSHIAAKNIQDSSYGCLFCIEERHKVDLHDATVFFSVTQLLIHIQKHHRPLPAIRGLNILYGDHPSAVDFDLCFRDLNPVPNPFAEIQSKLANRPTARAIATHRPNSKGFRSHDPNSMKTLQFAAGARIIGVTYPPHLKGEWCCGYHDNMRAFFPASMIQLEPPPEESTQISPKSNLTVTARWAYQPASHLSDTWLTIKPKETIRNISFPYQDFWCWSGMNSKGKYGLFPACFAENLIDHGDKNRLSSSVKEVSKSVTKVLSDGTKERWAGAGAGMWGGMSVPSSGSGSARADIYAANAPRPVRKGRRSTTEGSDSGSLHATDSAGQGGSNSTTPIGGSGRSFMGLSLGRRNTNASRGSEDNRSPS